MRDDFILSAIVLLLLKMISRREVVYFAAIFALTLGLASTTQFYGSFLSLAQYNRFRCFRL